MSVGTKLLQAAAGNAGEAVYVDDVFSTFLYKGGLSSPKVIVSGIDLSGEVLFGLKTERQLHHIN